MISSQAAVGPGTPVGLGPRVAAFALDYLPIAAHLALLAAVGQAVGWAFPDGLARAFAQAALFGEVADLADELYAPK